MNNLKKILFLIVLVSFSSNSLLADIEYSPELQAPIAQPGIAGPNGAKIKFERSEHNFGNISINSTSKCEFKFTNVGGGLLKISTIQSTCGCTIPTLEKKIYKAGESGTIKVEYAAGAMKGTVNKKIHVISNDRSNPNYSLTIKAEIQQKVVCDNETLNLLLNKENAGCPDVNLTSTGAVPFSVKRITSSFAGIKVDFDPNEKGTSLVLKPKVDVNSLNDYSYGKIDIELTHPECQMISIRFTVLPKFKLEPRYITLWQAEAGKTENKQLWILSNYNEDFQIASAESEKGLVKVLKQEKIGTRYKFDLQINPPAGDPNATMFLDKLIIKTKKDEKMEILCSGFYKLKEIPEIAN